MTGLHDSPEIKGDFIHQVLSFKNRESCPILECVCACVNVLEYSCICVCVCWVMCAYVCLHNSVSASYVCLCWVHVCGGGKWGQLQGGRCWWPCGQISGKGPKGLAEAEASD